MHGDFTDKQRVKDVNTQNYIIISDNVFGFQSSAFVGLLTSRFNWNIHTDVSAPRRSSFDDCYSPEK